MNQFIELANNASETSLILISISFGVFVTVNILKYLRNGKQSMGLNGKSYEYKNNEIRTEFKLSIKELKEDINESRKEHLEQMQRIMDKLDNNQNILMEKFEKHGERIASLEALINRT